MPTADRFIRTPPRNLAPQALEVVVVVVDLAEATQTLFLVRKRIPLNAEASVSLSLPNILTRRILFVFSTQR